MACIKCGSVEVVEGVRVLDHGDLNIVLTLAVAVERNPGALLFKNAVRAPVDARVCGACGFLEMYVKKPANLVRAAKSRKKA